MKSFFLFKTFVSVRNEHGINSWKKHNDQDNKNLTDLSVTKNLKLKFNSSYKSSSKRFHWHIFTSLNKSLQKKNI